MREGRRRRDLKGEVGGREDERGWREGRRGVKGEVGRRKNEREESKENGSEGGKV